MINDHKKCGGKAESCQLQLPVIWAVCLCCFFSGLTGLMYEVIWLRYLVRVFGVTTPATASILSIFMGGLALGAAVAGRKVGQIKDPLKVYALVELCLGLYALASPVILGQPLVTLFERYAV
ncbi:MAG: hypothetical protein HY711_01750, partial [Candidatus Melainabacteria bacterium]|nr:hypothetical protein [Candidatus Melainabacteria bacterium]